MSITKSVGKNGANLQADVDYIRGRLAIHQRWLKGVGKVASYGKADDALTQAIVAFQTHAGAMLTADGRVDPNGFTLKRLNLASISSPKHAVFLPMCWARGGGLTEKNYEDAAKSLGCEVAAIKAVAEVETKRGAYDGDGRPTILFERHKFRKHSNSAYSRSHPDISGSQGGYGKFSQQYPKLKRAATLNEAAALKSASWGQFQILGENFKEAGFTSVDAFVTAMNGPVSNHLDAFVSFIKSNSTLQSAIKSKSWATFAKGYNGPKYKDNDYDTKMGDAYKKHAPEPAKTGG